MFALEEKRVLAIDPTSRGFGFAILEGPKELLDWGVKQMRREKTKRTVLESRDLIRCYSPDVVLLEDSQGRDSRRCLRIGKVIRAIRTMAARCRIPVRCFSRFRVRQAFSRWSARTKHQIAVAIALELPALRPRLPRLRKIGMPEDERMAVFDAVSLAYTFYFSGQENSRAVA